MISERYHIHPGGTQQSVIRGGSAPRSNHLTVYIPFLAEKVPLSYTFLLKMVTPFTTVTLLSLGMDKPQTRTFCRHFHSHKMYLLVLLGLLLTKMTDFPTLSYTITSDPYLFIYLKPEKGTPYGQSLAV